MEEQNQGFSEFNLNKQILQAVEEAGFSQPTEIQRKAIPPILAGQDVIGVAQTGTGKTAAYLLPIIMKIKYAQGTHARALILAPTRELVIQIREMLVSFCQYTDVRSVALYGGTGMKKQTEDIEAGVDILVSTPGRFLDIYLSENLYSRQIKTLILDEADKMMDMGFLPQIRRILEVIPVKRQNLLFSATMSDKVLTLAEEFLEFPTQVEAAPTASPKDLIDQRLYHVPNFKTKIHLLEYLVSDQEQFTRVMVFVRTRQRANDIHKFLVRRKSGEIRVIHANKGQNTRINVMQEFKTGRVRILVTTDVSARGIDVSGVSHVINFDVPLVYEDYIHRIGRTGRVDQSGVAITMADPAEIYHIQKIEALMKTRINVKPIPPEVTPEPTPYNERQEQKRTIDRQRKQEDPEFKGAFHDKKEKVPRKPAPTKKKGR